jgi:hypothetical protein
LGTRPAIERAGTVTLHLQRSAPYFYPSMGWVAASEYHQAQSVPLGRSSRRLVHCHGSEVGSRVVVTIILAILLLTSRTLFLLRSESHDCGHFVARTTVNSRYSSPIGCVQNRPCASFSESEMFVFQQLAERQLQRAFSDSQILNLQTRVRFPVALPALSSAIS